MNLDQLTDEVIGLLRQLIESPSLSRQEDQTAELLYAFLRKHNKDPKRSGNNVWAQSANMDKNKPTLLLNSHHDTVKPVDGWKREPYRARLEGERLYGLGSNDAGASLVSLLATFLHLDQRADLPFNLVWAGTAEEEISGPNGIAVVFKELPEPDVAIVGEPTGMQLAVAEKGLMVIDGKATGKAGHAAREEGINALYLAMEDIQAIRAYDFDRISQLLGPTKATVTQVQAGHQHNVVPDTCTFVVDVRTNELYSNQEVHQLLQDVVGSTLTPRSYRLNSSRIDLNHPLVQAGKAMGLSTYGSPTLSDQALLSIPSLKMGPGDSARSHTADEYIDLMEIREGIRTYVSLLTTTQAWRKQSN
jgi:acetylornithine deacetylase